MADAKQGGEAAAGSQQPQVQLKVSDEQQAGVYANAVSVNLNQSEVILDFGMHRNVSGSRIYALVKGAHDAGVDVSCSKEVLPSNERLQKNQKTFSLIEKLKEKL